MNASTLSVTSLRRLFADTCRSLPPDRADRLIRRLTDGADLADAIDAAHQDGASELLADLLALREAQAENGDDTRLARRLKAEADAFDRAADHAALQAAEWFGKAAYRSGRGDLAVAMDFTARAEAAESAAAERRDMALGRHIALARLLSRRAHAAQFLEMALPGPAVTGRRPKPVSTLAGG